MPGIGIITNPHSKLNKRNPERTRLLGYILGTQGQLEVTNSLKELDLVARKFCEQDIEILAINGGDGTVARTITAFIRAYGQKPLPKIALLRGGTMNVLATNLGISGTPENLLYRLVEGYSSNVHFAYEDVASLKANSEYGFLYADGIACTVLSKFYENKTGPLGVIWLLIRIISSAIAKGSFAKELLRKHRLKISMKDKEAQSITTVTLMAATIERMPLGPKLFPLARRSIAQMQFFYVTTAPEKLVWRLPGLLLPPKLGVSEDRVSQCTQRLEVTAESGYTYSLDGELFTSESGTVSLEIGPVLQFINYRAEL